MAAAGAEVDRLGELEVLHAGLEAGLGAAAADDRIDEVLLRRPRGDVLEMCIRDSVVGGMGADTCAASWSCVTICSKAVTFA